MSLAQEATRALGGDWHGRYGLAPAPGHSKADRGLSIRDSSDGRDVLVNIRNDAWYLFADPSLTPVIEYAYVNGGESPTVEQQDAWTVLGQQFRVYQDFGCGFVDWRGAYEVPHS